MSHITELSQLRSDKQIVTVNVDLKFEEHYIEHLELPNCLSFVIFSSKSKVLETKKTTNLHNCTIYHFRQLHGQLEIGTLVLPSAKKIEAHYTKINRVIAPKCTSLFIQNGNPKYLHLGKIRHPLTIDDPSTYLRCEAVEHLQYDKVKENSIISLKYCEVFRCDVVEKENFIVNCGMFTCSGNAKNLILPETKKIQFSGKKLLSLHAPKCEEFVIQNTKLINLAPENVKVTILDLTVKGKFSSNRGNLCFSFCKIDELILTKVCHLDIRSCKIGTLTIPKKTSMVQISESSISNLVLKKSQMFKIFHSKIASIRKIDCDDFFSYSGHFDIFSIPSCFRFSFEQSIANRIILPKCHDLEITNSTFNYVYAPKTRYICLAASGLAFFAGRFENSGEEIDGFEIINEINGDYRLKSYANRLRKEYFYKMLKSL